MLLNACPCPLLFSRLETAQYFQEKRPGIIYTLVGVNSDSGSDTIPVCFSRTLVLV